MSPQQWQMLQYMMGQRGGGLTMADLLRHGGFQLAGDVVNLGAGGQPLVPANEDPFSDIFRGVYGAKRMTPTTPGSVQSPDLLDEGLTPANSNRLSPLAMYFLGQMGGYG